MALFEFSLLALFLIILVVVFLGALFFWGIRYAIMLAVNSVIGFFALYAIQAWVWPTLIINWISILIVAIGGIIGFILVLLFHLFGWWF